MEMYWNENAELKFQVYIKPNQVLKYLNNDSTYLPSVFKAIPSRVLERLGELTSKSKTLEKVRIDKMYPLHCQALKVAGLSPKEFPTFLELENSKCKEPQQKKREKRKIERENGIDRHSFALE